MSEPKYPFTFGLWTVGNRGRDPFGDVVRPSLSPVQIVKLLAEVGAYGVNLHDNDLVPAGSSARQRDAIVAEFKSALADHGLVVPMATTNLFSDPVFRDGAFTAHDAKIRRYALQKTMNAMQLGAELGAKTYVFWGGREGCETDAGKCPHRALQWFREALDFLCEYNSDQGFDFQFALEAKPNEPRGDIYLPTTGAMLGFIATLRYPDRVGVNPEVAHEQMAGLNFTHAVAQAHECGKLFHIDLNDQAFGRYDQDLRFGSHNLKSAFFLVQYLEEKGYSGSRHFDAHAYRSSDVDDVKAFAAGCMRTYTLLAEKAERFRADHDIQEILDEIHSRHAPALPSYSREAAQSIASEQFDLHQLAGHGLPYERLDQLVVELLMGVR